MIGVAALAAAPVAGLSVAGLVAVAPTAAAHDELVSSSPSDGDVMTEPVAAVELVFNNPIPAEFVQVSVLDAAEAEHTDGAPEVVGGTVTQPVHQLTDGAYTISYRVVSSDGHPITGTISFTVSGVGGASPPSEPAVTPSSPPSTAPPAETQSAAPADTPSDRTTPAAASEDDGLGSATIVLVVVAAAALVGILAFVAAGGRRRGSAEDTGS